MKIVIVLPQRLQVEQHAPGRNVKQCRVGKVGHAAGWGCVETRLNMISFFKLRQLSFNVYI